MRLAILALLLLVTQAPAVTAETIVDTYIAFRVAQEEDTARLNRLDDTIQAFFSKYDHFSKATPAELSALEAAAKETLSTIARMKERGKTMFIAAEHEYELFCIGMSTDKVRCSERRVVYKRIVGDTISLGGTYYTFSDNSISILAALGRWALHHRHRATLPWVARFLRCYVLFIFKHIWAIVAKYSYG